MDGIAAITGAAQAAASADRTTLVLAKAFRQARAEAAALVQLVSDASAPATTDVVGRHLSYRA